MIRITSLAGLLALMIGCSLAGRPVVEASEKQLQATMQVPLNISIGHPFDITFVLVNVGSATVEACFSDGFEVCFGTDSEPRCMAVVADHPGCVQGFRLEPGATVTHTYNARVPEVGPGPATLSGRVEIFV